VADHTVVFIASDRLGTGDDELGAALLLAAIGALGKLDPPPRSVLFMNAGVRLCAPESSALRDLRELAERGVDLACCGTCLDWFGLRETLAVGRASNMAEILALQAAAGRVIRL
jgi:selenium metabolism protein YedF